MSTIAAISTASGVGGIGIIRLSGEKAFNIIEKIFIPKNKNKEIKGYTFKYGNIINPKTNEVLDEVLECKPVDECAPQIIGKLLINFSGKFAGKERVQIINKFSAVDNAHWLPEPYKYLVRMENELYMLGIVGEQFYMIPIEGKKIEPLFYPELPDYMIVTDDENVKIIKYNENIAESFELIAEYKGSEIKLSNPVLDIEEGCIKLPIKIVQERFLKECSK